MQPRQDPTPKPGFYALKTDGGITAEQGAAGPAAIGVVLKDHKYRDGDEVSQPIGWARNHHEAEYKARIAGLELARRHGIDPIRVFSDSALVVNTVNGDWNLQPEHAQRPVREGGSPRQGVRRHPVILGSSGNEPRSGRTCKQSARPRPLTPGAAGSLPRPAAAGSAPSSGYTTMSSSACRRESPGWSTASSSIGTRSCAQRRTWK